MVEFVVNNQPSKKKKKRLPGIVRFFIGFIITILVIVALLVGAVFILFYDSEHKTLNIKEDYTNEMVFKEILVDSLDDAEETEKMKIAITEDQLNQILYNAFKDNEEAKKIMKNFYVEADNGKYNFVLEANAFNVMKSRLILNSSLEVSDEVITFKVDNVKVGRISGWQNLIGFAQNFVTLPDVDEALKDSGLNMHFDLNNLTISYNLDDFYHDLLDLMGGEGNQYTSIFYEFISNQSLRSIGAVDKNVFEIDVNIDQLQIDETTHGLAGFTTKEGYFNDIMTYVRDEVIKLLDNNKIKEEDAQVVARYFIGEETLLTDSDKSIINTYKANHVFDEYTTIIPMYDYNSDPNDNLKEVAKEQIIPQMIPIPGDNVEVEFDTDMIDTMFKTSTSLGEVNVFARPQDDDKYKLNYVVVDRISSLVKDNSVYFILSVNFNGCSGQVTLKTSKLDGEFDFGVMKLSIKDMFLGNTAVSQDTKNSFLELISKALSSGAFDDRFTIENDIITLNLKKTLDENGVLEELGYSTSFALVDSEMVGDVYNPGAIRVNATK